MQWAEIFSEVLIKENLHYHIKIILKQNWKESRIISQSFPNKIFFFSGISPVGLYWHCSATTFGNKTNLNEIKSK